LQPKANNYNVITIIFAPY